MRNTNLTRKTQRAEEAAAALVAERNLLQQWEAQAEESKEQLERLQASMGDEVLAAPERAEELLAEMQRLRDRVRVAESAAAAQRPKLPAVERAHLLAQADLIEARDVEPVAARLRAHDARTQELLAELEKHEGPFIHRSVLENSRDLGAGESRSVMLPKSHLMRSQLLAAQRQVEVVRDLADGRDPEPKLNEWNAWARQVEYPDCVWGPDALVPAGQYLRSTQGAHAVIADCDRSLLRLDADYDDAVRQWQRVDSDPSTHPTRPEWVGQRRANLLAQRTDAESRLAALGAPVS